jgi:hypothetical protein
MDERGMNEKGKHRKRKVFGIVIFMFVIRIPKARRANKAFIY